VCAYVRMRVRSRVGIVGDGCTLIVELGHACSIHPHDARHILHTIYVVIYNGVYVCIAI
jgi:hypothetical protein